MKIARIVTLLITIFCVLTISSCTSVYLGMDRLHDNNDQIADKTFGSIIDAIKSRDTSKIINLFSHAIQSDVELKNKVDMLIEFVDGEIISYSSSSEAGVGENAEIQNGKERKEILSVFSITTTTNEYYVAIKECTTNEIDHNNIGVISIYIIDAIKWKKDYVYRGDGKWTPGINIE